MSKLLNNSFVQRKLVSIFVHSFVYASVGSLDSFLEMNLNLLLLFTEPSAQSNAVKQSVIAMYSSVDEEIEENQQYPLKIMNVFKCFNLLIEFVFIILLY